MFINNLYEKIHSKKTQARSIHIYAVCTRHGVSHMAVDVVATINYCDENSFPFISGIAQSKTAIKSDPVAAPSKT
jgi:hypothetical protein